MATQQPQIIPLIDVDTSIFAEHYQRGLYWFLLEQHDHAGPLSVDDVVATFKNFTHVGLFDGQQEQSLRQAVGAYLVLRYRGSAWRIERPTLPDERARAEGVHPTTPTARGSPPAAQRRSEATRATSNGCACFVGARENMHGNRRTQCLFPLRRKSHDQTC